MLVLLLVEGLTVVSIGRILGVNAQGHLGWVTVKCAVCATKMDVTRRVVYRCPECSKHFDAYFCEADARLLRYKCPYCRERLVVATKKG